MYNMTSSIFEDVHCTKRLRHEKLTVTKHDRYHAQEEVCTVANIRSAGEAVGQDRLNMLLYCSQTYHSFTSIFLDLLIPVSNVEEAYFPTHNIQRKVKTMHGCQWP